MSTPQFFRRSFAIMVLLCALVLPAAAQQNNVVYEIQSKYQRITIIDTPNNMRQMIFDGKFDGTDAVQSEMNRADPDALTLSYSQHMIASIPLVAKPKRILVVGLGGACIQRYVYKLLPEVKIETAELDGIVLSVAQRFFGFREDPRQVVHIGDGRKFLEQSKDKYDLIMLDAFSATSIPYLLSTKEFLAVCKDHLAEGGVLSANLWYEQRDYRDMLKTYETVFAEFHVVRCARSTNAILVAFAEKRGVTPEKWMELAKSFEKEHPTGLGLPQLIDRGVEPVTRIPSDAKVLLDADADKHN